MIGFIMHTVGVPLVSAALAHNFVCALLPLLQQTTHVTESSNRYSMLLYVLMLILTALAEAAIIGPTTVERLPTESDCGGPWIYASPCRHAEVLQQPFMCQVCRSWAALDRVVSANEGNRSSKVSGDLIRHETQTAQTIQLLQAIIKRDGAATVCETGFNAGHSALLFLALPYAERASVPEPPRRVSYAAGLLACVLHANTEAQGSVPSGRRRYRRHISCTVCAYHQPWAYRIRFVWHHLRRCPTRPS